MSNSYDTRFASMLHARLTERIDEFTLNAATGGGIVDYAEYRRLVGEIRGLKFVRDTLMPEVLADIDKR
jgi:hypothetical protein